MPPRPRRPNWSPQSAALAKELAKIVPNEAEIAKHAKEREVTIEGARKLRLGYCCDLYNEVAQRKDSPYQKLEYLKDFAKLQSTKSDELHDAEARCVLFGLFASLQFQHLMSFTERQ
jgi:hypothetical protein